MDVLWFNLIFSLNFFLSMGMYDNEFETKVNNNLTEDQIYLCCIPVKLGHQLEAWMDNLQ